MVSGLLIGFVIGFFVGALFMVTSLRRIAERAARGVFGTVEHIEEPVEDVSDMARKN